MPAPKLRLEEHELPPPPMTAPSTVDERKILHDVLRDTLPAQDAPAPDRETPPPPAALGPVDAQAVARALGGPLLAPGEFTIPLPPLPTNTTKPWTWTDALAELRLAREGLGGLYDREGVEQWVNVQVQDFVKRGTLDGIQTFTPQALTQKREQLAGQVQELAREGRARWQTWRVATGQLLTDALGTAMTLAPFGALKADTKLEGFMARVTDAVEEQREREYLRHATTTAVVTRYRQSDDTRDRTFVRLVESGGPLPAPDSDEDVLALNALPRVVQARRLARVPPVLRDALAQYRELTNWRAVSEVDLADYVGSGLRR